MKQSQRSVVLTLLATAALFAVLVPSQAPAANKLLVMDSTGNNPAFVVTDSGYIGVGTSAPVSPLYLIGQTTQSSQLTSHFVNATAYDGSPKNGGGGYIGYFNYPNNGMPHSEDRLGYFLFGARDSDGTTSRNGAGFAAYAEADWTSASIPSYLVIQTAPSGSVGRLERVRVAGNGNVGIGTTPNAPTQKLEVVGGGFKLNSTAGTKTCNADVHRGTIWFTQGNGSGDVLEICGKDAGGAFSWKTITQW